MPVDVLGLIYAGVVAAGGIVGYLKAGSIPSLVAGVGSGAIAGYGAATSNFYVLLGISVLLSGLMGYRFVNSGKFMPPGLVASLSLLMVLRCAVFFFAQKKNN